MERLQAKKATLVDEETFAARPIDFSNYTATVWKEDALHEKARCVFVNGVRNRASVYGACKRIIYLEVS